ncbi:unnamed protein product [Paramecium sonneborni]|uniref:Uncharacterized protein n=1 Tax=Paramecium sonneborni TaxID=65129 RepID=A0A8S1L6S5_9CILI|nr:unnamed protein product [Paramecium sonneborni]
MSWGQPEQVPQQEQSWGNNTQQSTWGNSEQTWGNNGDQGQDNNNKAAWGDSNNGQENKEFRGRGGRGGRGDRGGRGRGGDRGGRGGRGRGRGNNDNKEEGEIKTQNDVGGGWGQQTQEGWGQNQQENKEQQGNNGGNTWGGQQGEVPIENGGGWGQQNTETQGWGGNQETNNQDGQQDDSRGKGGKGKKRDSPPPAKRVRPNPIVITVEDDEDSETQNIIINEYPCLQNKQKGFIKSEEQQICFEGNIKIDENIINTQFISFDTELKVKIEQIEDYTLENSKELLKTIGDQIIVGIVQGVDKDNQKAINKLADNLLDKQQSIHFKDVSLFSIKQLYKGQSTSRLAFVKQIQA